MVQTNTFTRFTARLAVSVLCAALLFVVPFHAVLAATASAPLLGSAQSFAVLGASTVTNTGATVITGDLGVSPGTAITGFQPWPFNTIVGPGTVTGGDGLVSGTIYASDPSAAQAHADAFTAYNYLVGQTPDTIYTPIMEIGGLTFTPGVYNFPTSAQITTAAGPVTLDFQNNPNAVFIFQIGSTLITDVGSQVIVKNGGQNCLAANVYWAVGSSATIGVDSQFVGNILALISITLNTGASVSGSALALTGAVTMDTNKVSVCSGGTVPPVPSYGEIKVTGGGQISVPDPTSDDANAIGTGKATFGFNAQPDKKSGTAKGNFNYVNHATSLHINGSVDKVWVAVQNADGTPKTVKFSGTYKGGSFIVTVEDRGEPGTNDKFGVAVIGSQSEVRGMRVISNGNIQFHK
jgi:hypothetical protein